MSNGSPVTDPDKVITGLRQELKRVSQHRDELERDVENLCMQNDSSSIFSSSLIVSERIYSTEKELSKTKSQLEAVLGERDSLRDDLRHHKGKADLLDMAPASSRATHIVHEQGGTESSGYRIYEGASEASIPCICPSLGDLLKISVWRIHLNFMHARMRCPGSWMMLWLPCAESKRLVDKSWRDQTGKTEALQRDLNFYQSQGARAVADRDKVMPVSVTCLSTPHLLPLSKGHQHL